MIIEIDAKWCKGCGLCIWQCPKQVFVMGHDRNEKGYLVPVSEHIGQCVGCQMCERICPESCIAVIKEDREDR